MPTKPRTKKTAKKLPKKVAKSLDEFLDKPAPKETPQPNPAYKDALDETIVHHPDVMIAHQAVIASDHGTFRGIFKAEDLVDPEDFNEHAPGNQSAASLEQLPEAAEGPGGDVSLDQPVPLPLESAQETLQEQLKEAQGPFLVVPADQGGVAAPPVAHSAKTTVESAETPSDALIVERLLNGINYLFPIARITKGQRGPQPKQLSLIAANMKLARQLVERLKLMGL